ncbi:MAG: alpha-L-fucosidase [Pirellulales bacterium]|nr:alpha-L-fucosidase [Pirellulales bacterium]
MNHWNRWILVMILGVLFSRMDPSHADEWIDPLNETKEQRDCRMQWWRDARFGMFIHWGVYSVPAGTYQGKKIGGIGEWIMHSAKIPVAEYKAYAKEFNPVKYDADAWVRLAKEAGMKYIVITSKHHDGFALFDSKVTDWDVVDATPYGKDLLRPLEQACKKHGLRLGFYYSQAQDWNHPGGAKAGYQEGDGWDDAHKGDYDQYLKKVAYPQVHEILTQYDLDILWWDTPVWMNESRAKLLRTLIQLRPGLITNNRLGGGFSGDSETPEQHIPATGIPGRDWETCMTMNDTWGYKSYDENWKTTATLIHNLVDITSKGGNYLLNVGPTSLGEIPQPSIDRLKEVGKWMAVNGQAIYGTHASPCRKPDWGRITTKDLEGGNTRLHLCVFDWPEDGTIDVPVANQVRHCSLLANPARKFEVRASEMEGIQVQLAGAAPDPVCSVIVLDLIGSPNVIEQHVRQAEDGSIVLKAIDAAIHNPGDGQHAAYESGGKKDNIGYWLDPRAWIEWSFHVTQPGAMNVEVEIGTPHSGSQFRVIAGNQTTTVTAPSTGDYDQYTVVPVGQITLDQTGLVKLSVIPVRENWQAINLRKVILKP